MEVPRVVAGLTALIVDDDASVRSLLTLMLQRLMSTPIAAENGQQAIQLFRAAPALFDLVICDWNMPGLSGIDVCQQVRAERPKLPFLMLTARRDLESVKTAQKNGISSYIVKPFTADDLKAKIASAMRKPMIVGELPRHH
jgi:two-component system, chemotaxis family, chemotaxis protein CheY